MGKRMSEGGNLLIKATRTSECMLKAMGSPLQVTPVFFVSQKWWLVTKAVYEVVSWILLVKQHYYAVLTKTMVGILNYSYFK